MTTAFKPRFSFGVDNYIEPSKPCELCGRATRVSWVPQAGNGPAQACVRRFFCGRWDCERCARFKRRREMQRIKAAGPSLHFGFVPPGRLEAVLKQVSREDGEYASYHRSPDPDEAVLLLSTTVFTDSQPVTSQEHVEGLVDATLETGGEWGKRRRVTHSRGWPGGGGCLPRQRGTLANEQKNVSKGGDRAMDQSGRQHRELVLGQEPEVVLAALQEMGSRVVKGPACLPGAEMPDAPDAIVSLELSSEAFEWLEDLLAGYEDPLGRVVVAWR